MAYTQKNHPFPVTNCGRRRSFMTTDSPIKIYSDSPMKRTKPYTAGMSAAERKSYCARSAGIKKCKDPDKNGDCPNDIARRNWKC